MANEAVCVENPTVIRDFTVADGTTIEQYTLCQLTEPRTASASSGADVFAGIAATEKEADDGSTNLGLAQDGIWDLKNSGESISAGAIVSLSGTNLIKEAIAAELLTGAVVGKLLEDAAADEVSEVDIGVRG